MQREAQPPEAGRTPRTSRFTRFVIVVVLMVAAGAAGAIVVAVRFREAQQAWQAEKTGLESKLQAQSQELLAERSREMLWRLEQGISAVYIDVTEKNFGLAHDEMASVTALLSKASTDLDAEIRAGLAPLQLLVPDLTRSIDNLGPDAKIKAREARQILLKLTDGNGK